MIEKIYLDMDGVIADFDKRWFDVFGRTPLKSRDKKEFSDDWENFIKDKNFEKLDWYEGGEELLSYIRKLNVPVEILSSSGGKKFHSEVETQKKVWLKKNGIAYKPNIVAGRKLKAEYASPKVVLIDDTPDVIDGFTRANGNAVLHKNAKDTIEKLKKLGL